MNDLYQNLTRDEKRLLGRWRAIMSGVGVSLLVAMFVTGSVLGGTDAEPPGRAPVAASSQT